jgi:hypothetical protein
MTDFLIKVFGFLIEFFWPGKLKELQVRIKRLDIDNAKEIHDFISIYDETFPDDGSNYTSGELLDAFEDIHNIKKHVTADNIILVAKYKNSIVEFIACFYYPKKRYGIIGYFGKTKSFKDEDGAKILKKLKEILIKEHNCELLVFELEFNKRDRAKAFLFKRYAKQLGLVALELDFDYQRPKLNLEDTKEEKLSLLVIPIKGNIGNTFTKAKVLDILSFIHFYCYGDYYETTDPLHIEYQNYMQSRIDFYSANLPDEINAK